MSYSPMPSPLHSLYQPQNLLPNNYNKNKNYLSPSLNANDSFITSNALGIENLKDQNSYPK